TRRRHQGVATNYLGHSLCGVVDDDGELVGGRPGRFPHHEVATRLAQINVHRPEKTVDKGTTAIADPEAPREGLCAEPDSVGDTMAGTRARIRRAFVLGVRRARGTLGVPARAGAWVDEFLLPQMCERLLVDPETLRLDERLAVPVEPEPAQIVKGLFSGAGFDARRVDVFHAQGDAAAATARRQPGNQVSAGV